MKPTGSTVTLTVHHWRGDPPVEGDFLRTDTGRCYQINTIRGRRISCTVLDKDAVHPHEPGVWHWAWTPRTPTTPH